MSAREDKVRHQREYLQRVEAVRNGQQAGIVMQKRPAGIVPAKNVRKVAFF